MAKEVCPGCYKPVSDHMGPISACIKFRNAHSALAIISTWLKVRGNEDDTELLGQIERLVTKTLAELK